MSQTELQNVYWIGGGSAAGKSTIADRIAAERCLSVYSTDDVMTDHARRSSPENCPLLHKFMAMDMDERWVNRPPQLMFETFHWFRGEGFDLISEDLLRLPPEPAVIVEGFRLLPRLVEPLVPARNRAVWRGLSRVSGYYHVSSSLLCRHVIAPSGYFRRLSFVKQWLRVAAGSCSVFSLRLSL